METVVPEGTHYLQLVLGKGSSGDGLSSKPGEHNLFSPHPGARGCRDYSHLHNNVPKAQEGQPSLVYLWRLKGLNKGWQGWLNFRLIGWCRGNSICVNNRGPSHKDPNVAACWASMAWSLAIHYPGEGMSWELDGPGSGQAIRQLFPRWNSWRWGRVGQFGCSPSFHGVGRLSILKSPVRWYIFPTYTRPAQLWVGKAQLLPLHRLCLLMILEVNVRSFRLVAQWSLSEANGPVHLLDQVETAPPWLPLLLLWESCAISVVVAILRVLWRKTCVTTPPTRGCTTSLSLTRWLPLSCRHDMMWWWFSHQVVSNSAILWTVAL